MHACVHAQEYYAAGVNIHCPAFPLLYTPVAERGAGQACVGGGVGQEGELSYLALTLTLSALDILPQRNTTARTLNASGSATAAAVCCRGLAALGLTKSKG